MHSLTIFSNESILFEMKITILQFLFVVFLTIFTL